MVTLVVKNPASNAGEARGMGLIPDLGRFSGVEKAAPFSILAWEIPWTEESGGLQSMGPQRVRHNWATKYSPLSVEKEIQNKRKLVIFEYSYLSFTPHSDQEKCP